MFSALSLWVSTGMDPLKSDSVYSGDGTIYLQFRSFMKQIGREWVSISLLYSRRYVMERVFYRLHRHE